MKMKPSFCASLFPKCAVATSTLTGLLFGGFRAGASTFVAPEWVGLVRVVDASGCLCNNGQGAHLQRVEVTVIANTV